MPLTQLAAELAERYLIEREIGSGGMATVYLARDVKHDRLVALKVLRSEFAALIVDRFRREIRLAAQFSHPHIVPLHDSGVVGDTMYYVMPFIEGETLRTALERRGALPLDEAIRIASQVGNALAYAHEHGVVHRDVKPANILLSRGEALLADFGIARPLDGDAIGTTSVGVVLGTPGYMSPEQLGGDADIDGRTDQYSLARVCQEMLSGKAGGSLGQRSDPAGLTPRVQPLPEPLAEVLRKGSAANPDERYSSVSEFTRHLMLAAGRPRPRWRLAARIGAVLAILVGAILVAGWLALPPSRRALLGTLVLRPKPSLDPRRVVIAPFEDFTNDSTLSGVGALAADVVAGQLASAGTGEVVDGRTALFTSKLVGQLPGFLRADNMAVALAREVSAGLAVSGSVYLINDSLRMRAQLHDAADGRVVRSVDEVGGPREQIGDLLVALGKRLVGALAIQVDPRYHQAGAVWATPPDLRSYDATARAFEAYYRGNGEEAISLFESAISFDSTYPTPILLYGYFRATRGEWRSLDSLLLRGNRLSGRFSIGERLLYDNLGCRLRGDQDCVLSSASALMEASPASAEIPTMVAASAVYLNRPTVALAALKRTDPRRGLLLVNPTYWRWATAANHQLARFEEEAELAARGLRQFPENGTLELAQARALAAAGRTREVDRLLRQAVTVGERRDWQRGAIAYTAYREFAVHGHRDAARRMADTLRAIAAATAADSSIESQGNRVALLYDIGDWSAALQVIRERFADRNDRFEWLGYAGGAAAHLNRRDVARAYLDSLARLDPADTRGYQHVWRARILATLGMDDEAIEAIQIAMRQGWTGWFGEWGALHEEPDFAPLRAHPAFQWLLTPDQPPPR